ncbi:MAG: M23 family metallopeptidase [Mariprofundaceae bacterium]
MIRIIISLLMLSGSLHASEYLAQQGEVVGVTLTTTSQVIALRCFGQTWPFKPHPDQPHTIQGWIGIDLKQKPGLYTLEWIDAKEKKIVKLRVEKTTFRKSYITVQKKMAEFDAKTLKRIRSEKKALTASYQTDIKDLFPNIEMMLQPVDGIISTPFGAQRYVNNQPRSPHSGVDIATDEGTPILAPLSGKVLFVADMYLNGNLIAIGHGHGLISVYAHLKRAWVKQGDSVVTGQKIAEVGSTGRSTGAHLHWGIRFNQARIDPLKLIR